jgi:hypothetical protein
MSTEGTFAKDMSNRATAAIRGLFLVTIGLATITVAGCGNDARDARQQAQAAPPPPPEPAYQLPPQDVSSLLTTIEAIRELDGSITVRGATLLPPNTQVWVERVSQSGQNLGQSKTRVGKEGVFAARGFMDRSKPIQAGRGTVEVRAHFNGFWQTPEVLAIVGNGGVSLPRGVLTPDDQEFPDAGGHWVEKRELQFPEIAPETIAIEQVKTSKLNVEGRGRSPTSVGDVVAWYAGTPGFTPHGWTAEDSGGKWIVTLNCTDAGQAKKAQWEFDPETKAVRYLDPTSKILSWLAND